MKIIQEKMQQLKDCFADYKVTLTAVFILTVYSAVTLMLKYEFDVTITWDEDLVTRVFSYFGFGTFFAETWFMGKKDGAQKAEAQEGAVQKAESKGLVVKLAAYALAAVLAIGITGLLGLEDEVQILGRSGEFWSDMASRFAMGYILLVLTAGVYLLYRRSMNEIEEHGFETYVLKVFTNLCKIFLMYITLIIGVCLVSIVFDMLFMLGEGNLSGACCILVTGFYLVPGVLHGLQDVGKETGAFTKMMVQYVLSILTICALGVVYLYVLKIVILWELPSNEIFSIISTLFCFGMPVWIMVQDYREGNRYSKVLAALPYVFAPLTLLQAYSMGVRIYNNGVTPNRYLGIMLIVFELVILVIWHFKKNKRENILVFLCGLIVIAVFVPGINMYSVSNRWQFSFLKKYYQAVEAGTTLTELEYDRLKGAYDYLKKQVEMEETMKEYYIYDEEFAAMLKTQNEEEDDLTKVVTHRIHCCQMVGELDVTDYRELQMLNQSDEYEVVWDEEVDVDFTDFGFVKRQTGEEIRVDIDEFAQRCIALEKENPNLSTDEMSAKMKEFNQIKIDEDTVLVINHFEVRYTDGIKDGEAHFEWDNLNISGMLLEK